MQTPEQFTITTKAARMKQRPDRLTPTNSHRKLGKEGPQRQKRTIAVKNLTKSMHKPVPRGSLCDTISITCTDFTIQSFQEQCNETKKYRKCFNLTSFKSAQFTYIQRSKMMM